MGRVQSGPVYILNENAGDFVSFLRAVFKQVPQWRKLIPARLQLTFWSLEDDEKVRRKMEKEKGLFVHTRNPSAVLLYLFLGNRKVSSNEQICHFTFQSCILIFRQVLWNNPASPTIPSQQYLY